MYEISVTNAQSLATFFGSLAPTARVMREDFSGTAALARAWVAQSVDPATDVMTAAWKKTQSTRTSRLREAVAIDFDAAVTKRIAKTPGLSVVTRDVMACKLTCDILAATNFAVGYFHTRCELVAYLKHARACLRSKGTFVCDMYVGSSVFVADEQRVVVRVPKEMGSGTFVYVWEQRSVDVTTGIVRNAIHFELPRARRTPLVMRDAFTYHWRLWSPPELREAMLEAGFKRVEMYDRVGDAVDQHGNVYTRPLGEGDEIDDPAVLYFAARK